MSEMIERVARTMAAAIVAQVRSGATFDQTPSLMICDEDSNSYWELMPVARAAIAAMREPTNDMTESKSYIDGEWSRRNIEAFIDAALAPHSSARA
ncbi:hypothetical protein V1291_000076 [Nitrobacteraceae bacterium AZCC 1564]